MLGLTPLLAFSFVPRFQETVLAGGAERGLNLCLDAPPSYGKVVNVSPKEASQSAPSSVNALSTFEPGILYIPTNAMSASSYPATRIRSLKLRSRNFSFKGKRRLPSLILTLLVVVFVFYQTPEVGPWPPTLPIPQIGHFPGWEFDQSNTSDV